jgi:hypothetical protein
MGVNAFGLWTPENLWIEDEFVEKWPGYWVPRSAVPKPTSFFFPGTNYQISTKNLNWQMDGFFFDNVTFAQPEPRTDHVMGIY